MQINWRPRSLFGKLLLAHLIVILITLLAIGIYFSYLVEKYFSSAHEWEITGQVEKIAEMLAMEFRAGNYEEVEKMSETLALSTDAKIRIIDEQKNNVVISIPQEGDFEPGVDLEPNEIDFILQGDSLSKKIYGPVLQRQLVAMPIFKEALVEEDEEEPTIPEVIGAIIVSAPLTSIKATVTQISRLVLYSFFFAAIVAGLLAFSLAKTISRPLQAMNRAARDMVKGNFRSRINVSDTGELGQLAATFNQAVEEVNKTVQEQKRLQALQQNLVANVSHDFRAPLTSIQGFAEAILEGFIREDEKEKYLRIILSNTLHLKRLVDDLLEFASIESGHARLRWEEVSPYRMAKRALDTVFPKARDKQIRLDYAAGESLPTIWGDNNKLYRVLVNLLENAIAYTPEGGKVLLQSWLDGENENIIFAVSDNGIGIPPEEIPYIWERFHKVDKARNRAQRGKGLGLSIVRKLVGLHHGQVKVESEPGKGSTFFVILPAMSKSRPDENASSNMMAVKESDETSTNGIKRVN
jgi:signal transduction histidine kinase